MPTYPKLEPVQYYPHPEHFVRSLHQGLEITSLLDVGAGHGGVFDHAFWSMVHLERRAACDRHWVREAGPNWETRIGVDVCDLTAHYEPKSFDMVQCMEVLEHVENSKLALEKLCAVARKLVVITSADETRHEGPEQERIEIQNQYQRYLKQPSVDDMNELGFEVRVDNATRRQLIAWKYL